MCCYCLAASNKSIGREAKQRFLLPKLSVKPKVHGSLHRAEALKKPALYQVEYVERNERWAVD
jgi:hypothetical protein